MDDQLAVFIQVRMDSRRLPGKVLTPILGIPMLEVIVKRLENVHTCHKTIVLTSRHQSDDPIADWCSRNIVPCFRGSKDNVLDRFYQCASRYPFKHIARITGDCPLVDPKLIDELFQSYLEQDVDYLSNIMSPTFPDGIDVEIFKKSTLSDAWLNAVDEFDKEHVTPYIYKNQQKFRCSNFQNIEDLSRYRLTVDYDADLLLIEELIQKSKASPITCDYRALVKILENHPELQTINHSIQRNENCRL